MILIIANKDDITTDYIVNRLNKSCLRYYRFNTEEIGLSVGINLDFSNEKFELIDYDKDQHINLNDIKSVYFRRPKLPILNNINGTVSEMNFICNEMAFILEGLYKILSDKFWISSVFSIREAENKIHQLILAKRLGFLIPDSIITSVKEVARDFILKKEETIVKPIKTGLIKDQVDPKVIFTSLFDKSKIELLNRIKMYPTYFQERISKKADLRITVVGNKVFTAKINSQEYDDTKVDWRKGSRHLDYEYFEIPSNIEIQCVKLTKALNLNFGAIDLVLDRNDNYIFLEINPNGQWAWIEERLGLPISEEIIKLLSKGLE
jgi:hypothetical protein